MEIHGVSSKRKVLSLLIGFTIVFVAIFLIDSSRNSNFFGNMQFCTNYEAVMQEEGLELADLSYDMTDAILYNGQKVPYTIANRTFYISQDIDSLYWEGELNAAEGYEIYVLEDTMWDMKMDAIAEGHLFSILIIKGNQCQPANIVASGLPILSLTETYGYENPQEISLLDESKEMSYEGYCSFEIRGQTSAALPKTGYNIELCDEAWSKEEASLLGMRMDDDWIINALYTDNHKVREKMAYQIWDEMQEYRQTPNRASNVTYVELILNNQYWGVYGLQEPVDAKQLSLTTSDVMYRKTDLLVPEQEDFEVEDGTETIAGFEIREPKRAEIKAEDWMPMQEYVKYIYYQSDNVDKDTIKSIIDVENVVDYEIFVQFLAAPDNIFKNINYVARYENGSYKMYQIPWDLDYTFGHDFGGTPTFSEYKENYEKAGMRSREYSALLLVDREAVNEQLEETWKIYRQSILDEEHLKTMAQSYMDELTRSGALARDTARWPESGNTSDLSEIYRFIEVRLEFLDEYYEDIDRWEVEHGI